MGQREEHSAPVSTSQLLLTGGDEGLRGSQSGLGALARGTTIGFQSICSSCLVDWGFPPAAVLMTEPWVSCGCSTQTGRLPLEGSCVCPMYLSLDLPLC